MTISENPETTILCTKEISSQTWLDSVLCMWFSFLQVTFIFIGVLCSFEGHHSYFILVVWLGNFRLLVLVA